MEEYNGVDPLFTGATRPTMKWGVTYEAMVIGLVSCGVIFLALNNPFVLLLYFPIHGICYLICLKEPRFFRILYLWVATKCKSLYWRFWGASTASPFVCTRNKNRFLR